MIKKGIYAASLSVLNENGMLNINETILHAESAIRSGLHGIFFFGSTGQSQLISINEKKEFISKISNHKLRKQFFLGTGCNSLNDNIDLIKSADHIIDLGPYGGDNGGQVVFTGTPEELVKQKKSLLSKFLKPKLSSK